MGVIEEARKLRRLIESMAENLDDETAEENVNVFPKWQEGVLYEVGYKVRYNDVLYKVIQEHTSQSDWTPDVAASLFARNHSQPDEGGEEEEFPEWVQPTGGHDAYNTGDKVTHNEKHWESLIDANVWEPGTTGTEALWGEIE